MAQKYVKIGSLIVTEDKQGNKRVSIGLGNKGKDPKYNLSVEIVVKDNDGKVIAKQSDGFINLEDPRTKPDELFKAGLINEELAIKMKENAKKMSDKVKYQLTIPRS